MAATIAPAIQKNICIFQYQFSCVSLRGCVMRSLIGDPVGIATEIQGRFRQGTDKIVSAGRFAVVARALWPLKTAAHLATIAERDERTAARWLSGEFEPPGIIIAAIILEITRRN